MEKKLIKFTDDFWQMLDKIDDMIAWEMFDLDSNPTAGNDIGIESIDVSDKNNTFSVVVNGKPKDYNINYFIRYFFLDKFSQSDINKFILTYNKIKNKEILPTGEKIVVKDFEYNPMDVKSTFISLVTETYPHGHEEEVMPFMPDGLTQDKYGNYYKIIGVSDTLFTSHLDTASRTKSGINLVEYIKDGQTFIISDGSTILGADDKSGVAVMLYMMEHNIPGVYYFFLGEERGGIGSGKVAFDYESFPFLKGKKKCISFDRRNYYSIITQQMGMECCSNEFGTSLCEELNKSGLKLSLDPTGIFTDSANFIDLIPECTNISVGYFNEHTHDEVQNITFLENLAKACIKCNWDSLVIKRRIDYDEELNRKHGAMIRELKKLVLYNEDEMKGRDGKLFYTIDINDDNVSHVHSDILQVQRVFTKFKFNPDITFDKSLIKIEIK